MEEGQSIVPHGGEGATTTPCRCWPRVGVSMEDTQAIVPHSRRRGHHRLWWLVVVAVVVTEGVAGLAGHLRAASLEQALTISNIPNDASPQVRSLIRETLSGDPKVCKNAVEKLGELKEEAIPAIPFLIQVVKTYATIRAMDPVESFVIANTACEAPGRSDRQHSSRVWHGYAAMTGFVTFLVTWMIHGRRNYSFRWPRIRKRSPAPSGIWPALCHFGV